MLTVFDWLQGMSAVGTLEFQRCSHFISIDKSLPTDFAFELSTSASIIVDVLMGSPAERTYGIFRDRAGFSFLCFDRLDSLTVAEEVILVPELPVLFDEWLDEGKLIGEKLLIFGTVEFIMSPLFERDVSTDKENKPADLFVLFLNDVK